MFDAPKPGQEPSQSEPQVSQPGSASPEPGSASPQPQAGTGQPPAPSQSASSLARPVRRGRFSLSGRAAPRLYLFSWLLTVVSLAVLVFDINRRPATGVPALIILELSLAGLMIGLVGAARAQSMQRRADGIEGYQGPSPVIVFLALTAALNLIAYLFVFAADRVKPDVPVSFGLLLELLLNLALYMLFVWFLVVRPGYLDWPEMLRPKHLRGDPPEAEPSAVLVHGSVRPGWELGKPRPDLLGDLLMAVALVVPAAIASGWLANIAAQVLGLHAGDIPSDIPVTDTQNDRIFILLAVAIVAPIGEEIFFRGFATTAWGKVLSFRRTILQGALFFASVHIVTILGAGSDVFLRVALVAILARVPVALALSFIFLRRRSIYTSMTLHGAYNALLILATFASRS